MIPKKEPIISINFIKLNFSFKQKIPSNIAKIIDVSLIDETTAIGRNKHAQTTMA